MSVVKAVEDAIGFFLSKRGVLFPPSTGSNFQSFTVNMSLSLAKVKRAFSAVYRGNKGYQETLLKSLEAIKTNSEKLIQQAQSAHFMYTQFGLTAIRTGKHRLGVGKYRISSNRVYIIVEATRFHNHAKEQSSQTKIILDDIQQYSAEACNNVLIMLNDAEENKKRQMQIIANQETILNRLAIMEEISRTSTPVPPEPSLTWQNQHSASFNSQFQIGSIPPHYNPFLQLAQQPNAMYNGQMAWFNGFSNATQQTSLSPQPRTISSSSILDMLNIPLDLDSVDIMAVKDYSYRLPRKYHTRAVQVTQTREFRHWIVTPTSTRLLIHGQFSPHNLDSRRISPLSFFCLLLVHMLRERERYITLVFFCGCHVEDEDENVGGAAIIRSFIAQLLQQVPFDFMPLDMTIDLDNIAKGDCDISQLCDLFVYLVRHQLRRDRTIVCIIDGIGDYETDELESDMLAVMRMLLQFRKAVGHGNGAEPPHGDVKVLVTTPFTTEAVQELFLGEETDDEENLPFLTMASFPDVNDTVGLRMPALFLNRQDSDELV